MRPITMRQLNKTGIYSTTTRMKILYRAFKLLESMILLPRLAIASNQPINEVMAEVVGFFIFDGEKPQPSLYLSV